MVKSTIKFGTFYFSKTRSGHISPENNSDPILFSYYSGLSSGLGFRITPLSSLLATQLNRKLLWLIPLNQQDYQKSLAWHAKRPLFFLFFLCLLCPNNLTKMFIRKFYLAISQQFYYNINKIYVIFTVSGVRNVPFMHYAISYINSFTRVGNNTFS